MSIRFQIHQLLSCLLSSPTLLLRNTFRSHLPIVVSSLWRSLFMKRFSPWGLFSWRDLVLEISSHESPPQSCTISSMTWLFQKHKRLKIDVKGQSSFAVAECERVMCIYIGIWSKCLPKMAKSRVHMGARYIFFTCGTHSWLMKETWTKQVSAPNCKRRQKRCTVFSWSLRLETKDMLQVSLGNLEGSRWNLAMFSSTRQAHFSASHFSKTWQRSEHVLRQH